MHDNELLNVLIDAAEMDRSGSSPTTDSLQHAPLEPGDVVAIISEILDGAEARSAVLLKAGVVTVGRDAMTSLPVRDKYASRQHLAIISSSSGEIWLIDTSSTGTVISFDVASPQFSVRHAGIQVERTVEVYVGCRLRNGERYPQNSSRFRITCMKLSAENREWQATCTPWPKVPPAVKDVVKCLPTHINMKNLDMEEIKAPRLQEEKRKGMPKSSTCKPYSAKIMQAFSIYDFWSKKLPLPVTTLYAEVPRSLDGGIENDSQVIKLPKKRCPAIRSKFNHKRNSKLLQNSASKEGACSLQVE